MVTLRARSVDSEDPVALNNARSCVLLPLDQGLLTSMEAPPISASGDGTRASGISEALSRFALRLQALMHAHPDLAAAADAVAGELARALGAERVSIGLRDRGMVRLLAASAEAERQPGSGRARALEHAMDEAIDQACAIHWPARTEDPPRITALHGQYARLTQSRLVTVPLVDGSHVVGAVTFEYPMASTPPDSVHDAADFLAPVGPLFALRQIAEAGYFKQRRLKAARAAPDQLRRRWTAWLVAALCLLGAVIPVADRIGAPVRVEGELQRVLVAPVDGYIGAVHVRPGDAVREGQVLAELARDDLLLERDRWVAALAQHENAYRDALARGERLLYAAAIARASEAAAELERVQAQLARSQLVAPFDGLLIRGDLTQSIGAPVRRGEILLTVSPQGRHRVIAEIEEQDIERVRQGSSGVVVLAALPDLRIQVFVKRIFPAAISRDGRTFYDVETSPATGLDALRPGLMGQVRFEGGRGPLALVLGRRLLDWTRLQLWSVGAWLR